MKSGEPKREQEKWMRELNQVIECARSFAVLKKKQVAVHWQIDLSFVSLKKMAEFNEKYRGKKGATDILSFSANDFYLRQGHLGELMICTAVLNRQAQRYRHSKLMEFRILAIHGVLHLLGFDHERSESEAQKMAVWENKIFMKVIKKPTSQGLIARSSSVKARE